MKPITRSHTNKIFNKPVNWNSKNYGICDSLPVSDYQGVLYSYWKPSWKEKFKILFGYPIRLSIASSIQPPVFLDVEK